MKIRTDRYGSNADDLLVGSNKGIGSDADDLIGLREFDSARPGPDDSLATQDGELVTSASSEEANNDTP